MMDDDHKLCLELEPDPEPPSLLQACHQTLSTITNLLFLIPAFFLLELFIYRPLMYFPDLGLMIPKALVALTIFPFMLLWLDHRPPRQPGLNHFLPQLWYYLFPVSLASFAFFCQKYLFLGVLLVAVLLVITAGYAIWLWRKGHGKDQGGVLPYVRKVRTFIIGLFAATLIFPGAFYLSANGFYDPSYQARQALLTEIFQDAASETEATEPTDLSRNLPEYNSVLLNRLKGDVWADLSIQARLDTMQGLMSQACLRLGVPPEFIPTLHSELYLSDKFSSFHADTRQVSIDLRQFSDSDPIPLLTIVLYNAYYVYEYYVVTTVDWEDPLAQTALYDAPRAWQSEIENNNYTAEWDSSTNQMAIDAQAWSEEESSIIQSLLQDS